MKSYTSVFHVCQIYFTLHILKKRCEIGIVENTNIMGTPALKRLRCLEMQCNIMSSEYSIASGTAG